jgi:hypothetical protein
MQPIGYFIIIVLVLFVLLTLKKMYTGIKVFDTDNSNVFKITTVNNPICNQQLSTDTITPIDNKPVSIQTETALVAPAKQLAYNPDQPDYHPGDGNINTGSAPTGEVLIPNEFAYDYGTKGNCDMGVLLGDSYQY